MSPRERHLAAVLACLQQITTADGYNTDAGATATTELDQVASDATAALAATISRQSRATAQGKDRSHRYTEVSIVIKLPTAGDDAQALIDAAVSDIERAMEPLPANQARFPAGYDFPQYAEMRPLHPEQGASAGWIGALLVYQSHIPIR